MYSLLSGEDVFTPKELHELPRPSGLVVDPSGDIALVGTDRWSFGERKFSKAIVIIPLPEGPFAASSPIEIPLEKGGEAFWLDNLTLAIVVYGNLKDNNQDQPADIASEHDLQHLYTLSLEVKDDNIAFSLHETPIGRFPPGTNATNFVYSPKTSSLIFTAYVYPDQDLMTIKQHDGEHAQREDSAMVFDGTYIRNWDTWAGPKRSTIFSVWLGVVPGYKNAQAEWKMGSVFECPLRGLSHFTPVEPFGDSGDFSVSESHLVYTSKDPELPEALHTRQNIYMVPLPELSYNSNKAGSGAMKGQPPSAMNLTPYPHGIASCPIINSTHAAWLEMAEDGYDCDHNRIILYELSSRQHFSISKDWDRSPESIVFSSDGRAIIGTVGDDAVVKVFKISLPPTEDTTAESLEQLTPSFLTHAYGASSPHPLPNEKIIFLQSSTTHLNELYIVDSDNDGSNYRRLSDFSHTLLEGKNYRLEPGEKFYFSGSGGTRVQGWVYKPPGVKEGQEAAWPVMIAIHGGPQSVWPDQWSTRWNVNCLTHQGYFVVSINFRGSTSFGKEFMDEVTRDWGGKPFEDLLLGWKYVQTRWPEIDPARVVGLGGSYGGFAINWLQGHPEYGFNFKALICHSGTFDTKYTAYSVDALYILRHDFGGDPDSEPAASLHARFSPANFVSKWSTPELLLHGMKDFRVSYNESLAAFHALQMKGVPSRLVLFPDENHFILKPANSLKWYYEVFKWMEQYVGRGLLLKET